MCELDKPVCLDEQIEIPIFVDCPLCYHEVMLEGVESGELVLCPHCKEFVAVYEIWKELEYSNVYELEDL